MGVYNGLIIKCLFCRKPKGLVVLFFHSDTDKLSSMQTTAYKNVFNDLDFAIHN